MSFKKDIYLSEEPERQLPFKTERFAEEEIGFSGLLQDTRNVFSDFIKKAGALIRLNSKKKG